MSRPGRSSMDNNSMRDRIENIKEWLSEHTKIVMPLILLICVMVTVFVAVNANKKAAEEVEAQTAEVASGTESTETVEEAPELELEENAYPAVNTLMSDYYSALAAGDIDAVVSMNAFVDDTYKIRIQEMSKYIDSYPEIDVYTKKGPVEDSYLAYVYSKVKFTEYEELVPGMQAYYVCTDESGSTYINEGEDNSVVTNYIRDITLQDDIVDLNNRIAVEYNELLENDEELTAFLVDLSKRVDISVGETLAKAEEASADTAEETAPAGEEAAVMEESAAADSAPQQEAVEAEQTDTVKTVRATDVVNVRSSDSETADKVGKAQIGDEFTLLEEKGNGWSKITFEDKDAFIKSEFLETVSVEAADQETAAGTEEEAESDEAESDEAGTEEDSPDDTPAQTSADGGETVTVIENVNVRKSTSETAEKLGLAYIGEKLELVMKQADGWTKVKYNGQTGYVKSDYVE